MDLEKTASDLIRDTNFEIEIDNVVSNYLEDDFRDICVDYGNDGDGYPTAEIRLEDYAGRKFDVPIIYGEQAIRFRDNKPIMGACIDIGDAGTLEFTAYEVFRYLFHKEAAKRQA